MMCRFKGFQIGYKFLVASLAGSFWWSSAIAKRLEGLKLLAQPLVVQGEPFSKQTSRSLVIYSSFRSFVAGHHEGVVTPFFVNRGAVESECSKGFAWLCHMWTEFCGLLLVLLFSAITTVAFFPW
jgi:hypothetical protein